MAWILVWIKEMIGGLTMVFRLRERAKAKELADEVFKAAQEEADVTGEPFLLVLKRLREAARLTQHITIGPMNPKYDPKPPFYPPGERF